MRLSCHGVLKGLVAIVVSTCVALSVYAQYQTPTSPRGATSGGLGGGLGSLGNRSTNQGSTTEKKPSRLSERFRNLKKEKGAEGTEKTGEKAAEKPAEKAAAGKEKAAGGPKTIAPGTEGAAGAPNAPAVPGIHIGAMGEKAGAPGAGAAPGAAGAPAAAPGGAGVRVVGAPTYDPILQRKVEYPKVPDPPNAEAMGLSGPMTVGDFLSILNQGTDWNVLVTDNAQKVQLNFWISGVTPSQALEVLQFHDICYTYEPETRYLRVMTKDEYLEDKYGDLKEHEFIVQHAGVDYIESVLKSLLSPTGRLLVDPRTKHLMVWDRQDNLDKMQVTIKELDVPLSEEEFQIAHANVADIEAVVNSYLSPGGTVISDPRTGRIVVKDLPDNLKQMREAVAKFDVPLTPRVFQVHYMNADALTDSIQALLTPERGMMQMDPRTNQIIVTDLPARQDRIGEVIEALDRQLETRTWVLQYIEPEDVSDRIENLVPEEMGNIITDEDVHQLTVTALPERLEEIDQMIKMWDVKRRQVLIEAYLVTAGRNLAQSLNVNWSYFDNINGNPVAYRIGEGATPDFTNLADTLTYGQLPYAEPLRNRFTGDPITDINGEEIINKFHGDKVAATINYLDTNGKITVLSAPRVTVQDGAEAMFQSGRNVPYVTSTTYDYSGGYNTNTTNPNTNTALNYGYRPYNRIEFIEVGTILTVMPRISEDGSILLEISAEDSDATSVNVVSNGEENTIPEKTVSLAETQVRVQDGQTIVIGGLRRGNSSKSVARSVPLLSDLPILGTLFRSPSKTLKDDTLMIFLTITVVDEGTHPEAEQLAKTEEQFSEMARKADKSSFGRLWESVTHGKNEIGVSIGQNGDMHSGGQRVTMESLRQIFNDKKNAACRVVVRAHPRAPQNVVTEVTELAMEAQLKVEFDETVAPFVPNYSRQDQELKERPVGFSDVPQLEGTETKIPNRSKEPMVVKPDQN